MGHAGVSELEKDRATPKWNGSRVRVSPEDRAASEAQRRSEFCTNHCNSSEIYFRTWLSARIEENARIFQPNKDMDEEDPYKESVETNIVTKDFQVVIKVLAFNRLESLVRCLTSLARADYGGDTVHIQIFVDHYPFSGARANNNTSSEGAKNPTMNEQPEVVEKTLEERQIRRRRSLLWSFPFSKKVVTEKREESITATRELKEDESSESAITGESSLSPYSGDIVSDVHDENVKHVRRQMGRGDEKGKQTPGGELDVDDAEQQHNVSRRPKKTTTKRSRPKTESVMMSINSELEEAHKILEFVDTFFWVHGKKEIHYRSQNVGLQAQWVESWWPANLDEFAFIVEDDMEVSDLYYRFLRTAIATYYYNPEHYDPSVYGISLQRPRFVPGRNGFNLKVNSTKNLFMYPLVGTWGQLLFPKQWKEFRLWYDARKWKGEKPFLQGMKTNSWYKKLGDKIWTPWFIKFVHSRGYFNLYTNFDGEVALSVSHRESGVNYKKSSGPDSRLITMNEGNHSMLWVMSPPQSLQRYDYCFREVKVHRLAKTLPELNTILDFVSANTTLSSVVLVNTVGVPEWLVRNWLCHTERLGLRNFVLLGDNEVFTSDLARRGYATMSSQLFSESDEPNFAVNRDLLAVQAVQGILSLGYNVWLTRADTVWIHNPLLFLKVSKFEAMDADFFGSEPLDRFHPALLYIKSSPDVSNVWGNFVQNMTVVVNSTQNESIWPSFRDFVNSATMGFRYQPLPSNICGGYEDMLPADSTKVSSRYVILLNGVEERRLYDVLRRLNAAGLLAIDKDLSCKQVYCQPIE